MDAICSKGASGGGGGGGGDWSHAGALTDAVFSLQRCLTHFDTAFQQAEWRRLEGTTATGTTVAAGSAPRPGTPRANAGGERRETAEDAHAESNVVAELDFSRPEVAALRGFTKIAIRNCHFKICLKFDNFHRFLIISNLAHFSQLLYQLQRFSKNIAKFSPPA